MTEKWNPVPLWRWHLNWIRSSDIAVVRAITNCKIMECWQLIKIHGTRTHQESSKLSCAHIYLCRTSVRRSNRRNDRCHRSICRGAGTGRFLCRETRIFCMVAPARRDLIIKCHKRLYHIGWSGKWWWKTNYKKELFRSFIATDKRRGIPT